MPKVSVIMPAYNAAQDVSRAIESILFQTLQDFELIIVNDGSTDQTLSITKKYADKDKRIILLDNKRNRGVIYSINRGLRAARGKYIARMDADDVSLPERLEVQVRFLDKHTNIGVVGAQVMVVTNGAESGIRRYPCVDLAIKRRMMYFSAFCHPVVMMRRQVFDKRGYYDKAWASAEDLELWFRLAEHYKFANIDKVLLKYSVNNGSVTGRTMRRMALNTFRIRWLNRRSPLYGFGLLALAYNVMALAIAFIFPPGLIMKMFERVRKLLLAI